MVLRSPNTLLDASLLQDDPFKSCFELYNGKNKSRKCRITEHEQRIEMIVSTMQSTTDGLNAPTLWLVNAFHISAQEAAKPDMLKIFIEFYWRLHRHTADDAKSYLHGVCKQRKMDWRPDLSIQLRPVAARAATRKKRRKREGAENMYGADVEDNAAADRVRVARSISDSNVDTPTRSRRNARGSSVRNEVVRISAAIQSPSAPVKSSGESKLNVRAGSRRVRRPRKRKSRKHGASSSSAASEEDVPEEKSFVTTEETTFSHVVSSNDEHPEPARDDSQSIPKPIVFTKSALPKGSETCTQVSTSTEAVHDRPVSDSLATPVVEVALSAAKKPVIPLLKASVRKQNPIPKRPTRMQPHRPAAKREQLTEPATKEHLYQQSRGRQDDAFIGLSTSRKESTGSATPKAVGKSVSALPEEDAAHSKEVETIHRNDADTSGNAQDAPRPGLLSSRQPKTAKKPIVLRQDDSILTQVAKRRRRNDGTASSPSPGVIGTTMNTERPKTVKKPTVVQQDESILTQVAKRSRRGDGETPSLSPGLGETANGIARSETAITPPPQPSESAHQCNAENPSSLGNHIDTGAVLTESGDAEKAGDQRVEPSVTSRELERGRKRSRSQDGATDGPSERLSHEAEDDKKIRLSCRIRGRPKPTIAFLTETTTSCSSATSTINDFATIGKVIQDVATAYREDLVPPAEPVSESWEAGNPDDHRSHEPQEEEESDGEQTSSAIPTHILAPQAQDQTFSENPGDHQVTGTVVTVANALPDHNLFYPRPMLPRAPLPRYPPIWAESRQEVCESFDWFRSYQGGVYFMKGQVKGYLLGGFSASRDLFHNDGRLIISHGGGKAESIHKHNGLLETLEASDQMEEDKSVHALLGVYRTKRPVALLIDENYKLFPYDLSSKGCTYAVLGWYYIAHAWAEYQFASNTVGRVVRYKFAFQWCESQGQPWWMFSSPEDTFNLSHGSPSSTNSIPAVDELTICMENMTVNTLSDPESHRTCQLCGYSSPTVYEQGWMCLQPGCPLFWRRENGEEAPAYLTYSQVFLRPVPSLGESLQSIYPSPPGIEQPSGDVTTTRRFCKGWHCSKCGRLSSRYKWEHWECRCCKATYGGHGRFRFAYEFKHQTTDKNWGQYWYHEEIIKPLCVLFRSGDTFGTRSTFILPHGRGRIHMLTMNPRGNRHADEIFVQYQDEAKDGRLRFRRWPMRAHKCRGTLLTNYFSQNTGEPYQYVGGSENTVPFDQSPKAVVKALNLIHARIREASIELQNPFNEILSAAYMEEQKMAFHSDSERGLGPVVASLSLGASACMYFRLHARYAFDEMPDENPLVLKLFLRHGDVVVMEGAGVQTCYEHTVVPLNFRIAATARYIGSDHQ